MNNCNHKRILVLSNKGSSYSVYSIRCENCGCQMTRRVENNEYVYYPVKEDNK